MKNSAVFFKDTYILKVHQLNRISDFKYLSCVPGCGTWSIYEKYFPCFHRTRKILEMQFKCAFNAFLSIYILVFSTTIQMYLVYVAMDERVGFIY